MSRLDDRIAERQARALACGRTVIALVAAGSEIMGARGSDNQAADELVTAIREDIQALILNVNTLRQLLR